MSGYPQNNVKAAVGPKVIAGTALNQAGHRLNGPSAGYCPTSAHELRHDQFMRGVNQNTLDMRGGGAYCNHALPWHQTVQGHLHREALERPYMAIPAPNTSGNGDLMGVGRDWMTQGIYDGDTRGNFVRHSQTLALPDQPRPGCGAAPAIRQEVDFYGQTPMDATSSYYYRG